MGPVAAAVKPGDRFTDGWREYAVLSVAEGIVEYLDCYPGEGDSLVAVRRQASLVKWEVDVAAGDLRPMAATDRIKGGTDGND